MSTAFEMWKVHPNCIEGNGSSKRTKGSPCIKIYLAGYWPAYNKKITLVMATILMLMIKKSDD